MNATAQSRFSPPPALLLFAACLCIYSVTLTRSHLGYEAETIGQARALLQPGEPMRGRAGLLDVAFYLPFVVADEYIRRHGLFPFYQGFVPNFALPFFMALTAVFVFRAAAELFSQRAAAATGMVFAFGTMAWPYSKMGMELSLTFSSALALWGFVREIRRPGRGGYLILAAGLGLMLLAKVQGPVVILLFLFVIARGIARKELPAPSRGEWIGALGLALIAMGIFLAGNAHRYDRLFMSTSYHAGWETAPPSPQGYLVHLIGYLMSPGKSLFLFNPPLLLLTLALVPFAKAQRWYCDLLLIFILPQVLFHAYFRTWADETWGPRRLVNLLPALALPIGMCFESAAWGRPGFRRITLALCGAGVLLQMLAVSMNYASYIFTLQPHGLGTQRNIVWNAPLTQIPFQARLLASCIQRWSGGNSLRMTARARDASSDPEDFLPWNAPVQPPREAMRKTGEPIVLNLGEYDRHFDFWWALKASRTPDWAWWRDRSFYLVVILALTGVVAIATLLSRASPAARRK